MSDVDKVISIVRDAGGILVGRTRLQKTAYILTAAGIESGLSFVYKHYGPFSELLAAATDRAVLLDRLEEEKKDASWGGKYSIYKDKNPASADAPPEADETRKRIITLAAAADAIELELAATAIFLARQRIPNPWIETARRKPEKATGGGLERAKTLFLELAKIKVPQPWPETLFTQ